MVDAAYYTELLRQVFDGRKVIVCADVLVGAAAQATSLSSLGIQRPLLLAGTRGTGTLPSPDEAEQVLLNVGGDSMMSSIRAFESALHDLPAEAMRAIDAYDPDREAIVVGTLFMRSGDTWGRSAFGGRTDAWAALEDKLVVDELLDAAGIPRAPSEIVPIERDALMAAAARLDEGLGTAWAGDATAGFWGGAEYLRWVRTADDVDEAVTALSKDCVRARVMPFLEGIPCSIHGFVVSDDVIALRPVEMLTLRRPGSNKLHYAGTATYWDPPDADREHMRGAARSLGALLRERVDYRGGFTLDGVMTAHGFRPTEVNSRAGAGLAAMARASGVNLQFISSLMTTRPDLDVRAKELEAYVIDRSDADRFGACYSIFPKPIAETSTHEVAGGTYTLGPSAIGGFIRFDPDAPRVKRGPSFAPAAVRAFAYADATFDTGLGPLGAARSVR